MLRSVTELSEMDVLGEEAYRYVQEIAKESGLLGDIIIQAGPFTKAGDGYIGVLLAIEAAGQDAGGNPRTLNLVLKRMHKEESVNESLNTVSTFATEINLYCNLAPTFREFQKSHGQTGEDLLSFIPKCYKTMSDGVGDLIFLEDLRKTGFTMRDRRVGLSYEDCMLVMRSLGKLHAFSYAMKEKDPKTFKRISDPLMTHIFFNVDKREQYNELYQKIAVSAVEGVRQQSPELAEKIEPLVSGGYFDVMTELISKKDDYSVITHGDSWTNNILFRDNPPTDIRFVDFPEMVYMSPTSDVMYTLNTSVSKVLRDAHFEDFLQGYLSALTKTLRQLGSNVDTLPMNVFKDQIRKYALCSLGYTIYAAPLIRGGEYEEEKHFKEEDEMVKIILKHNCCMKDTVIQKLMTEIVSDYVNRGYI